MRWLESWRGVQVNADFHGRRRRCSGACPDRKEMSAYVQYGVAAGGAERLEAVRRAGWSSAAALGANGFQGRRRERGGVGGDVGMRGFRNFGVGGAEFLCCQVQRPCRFWARQADPKQDRLACRKWERLLFPVANCIEMGLGERRGVERAGTPGGPILGTLLAIPRPTHPHRRTRAPPSSRAPISCAPHPLPPRPRSLLAHARPRPPR